MGPLGGFRTSLGLFLAAGLFCSHASAFPRLPAVDRHGDPLPAGAVARLGTVRLRAACTDLHFSADGRFLVGIDAWEQTFRTWDAADGRLRQSYCIPGYEPRLGSRSPDGRSLLQLGRVPTLIDLSSGKPIDVPWPTGLRQLVRGTVSADRRWVVLVDREAARPPDQLGQGRPTVQRVLLWETTTSSLRTVTEDEAGVIDLAVSPDGKRLFTSSARRGTRVWDTATGKRLWEAADYNADKCHFTPDGKHLIATPGHEQGAWRIWDAETGEPSKALRPPGVRYAGAIAVSPDGHSLLIPTATDYVVWDLTAGAVRHRWEGADHGGRGTFAPDGRSVVTYDTVLRRWDLATGKNLFADMSALGHTGPVHRVLFHPDGSRLVSVGFDRAARVWDATTSRLLRTIQYDGPPTDAWAVSPDGTGLVRVDEQLVVQRWALAADGPPASAPLGSARQLNVGLRVRDARVGPDGALTLVAWPRLPQESLRQFSFSSWELATGRLIWWGGDPGRGFDGDEARLSPDGRLVATARAVFDTRTGTSHPIPTSPVGSSAVPVFSPDGRLLAAGGTRVSEAATGRVLTDLPRRSDSADRTAFSPDGRRVACAGADGLTVWDLVSRTAVAEWALPSQSLGLAFSPAGRTVATGHGDGTILLWPVPPQTAEGGWSAGEGSSLWQDLGDEMPGNAWSAVWQLAHHPGDAVRLLRGKYALAPVAAADEFGRLIAGLDSPKFAEREAASKRLAELGRAAERPLRQALRAGASPEQAKRIESILHGLATLAQPRGEDLRAVRAVAVLDACGTSEARQLLAEWAERGPPRLSDEAARAVERLKWQPVRP